MTEAIDASDAKQIAEDFQAGLRRLEEMAVATGQGLGAVRRLKEVVSTCDRDVTTVRTRCATLVAVKDDLIRLEKVVDTKRNQARIADQSLSELAAQIGDAVFRSVLEGRSVSLAEAVARLELQNQCDALKQEREELGKTPAGGLVDKAKLVARQTALSGQLLLLQQRVTSADKLLGNAVLQRGLETEILSSKSSDLLSKIANARKAISDCAEAVTSAETIVAARKAKAIADLSLPECDPKSLDADYKKCSSRLIEIETNRLKARWNCGQAILSMAAKELPEALSSVVNQLNQLKARHPDACKLPAIDKRAINTELTAQVNTLYQRIGSAAYEIGDFRAKFSKEFTSVDLAKGARRNAALRQLGMVILTNRDEQFAEKYPSLQAMCIQTAAIEMTVKELDGTVIIGTGGKKTSLSATAVVTMLGSLAVAVLLCGGLLTAMVKDVSKQAKEREGRQVAKEGKSVSTSSSKAEPARKIAPATQGSIADHWGIVDSSGKQIVPCGVFNIGLWGGGPEQRPAQLDQSRYASPLWWKSAALGNSLIPARRRNSIVGEWGYIDRNGKQRVPNQFQQVTYFSENLAAVQNQEGQWGFITHEGKWGILARYDEARPFASNGLAAVRKKDKWGFVSKTGAEIIPFKYTQVRNFSGNRASVSIGLVVKDWARGGWGVIDEKGNTLVECKYFNIGPFHSNHAVVWQKNTALDDAELGVWGIMDAAGKLSLGLQRQVVFPIRSWGNSLDEDELDGAHATPLFGISVKGDGIPEMRILTPAGGSFTSARCQLRMGQNRGESLLPVTLPSDVKQFQRTGINDDSWGKTGYLDSKGNLVVPYQFKSAEPFSEGRAAICQDTSAGERWGFIDQSGKLVIKPQFTMVRPFTEGKAAVQSGKLWGYIDKDGRWIAEPQWGEATPFSAGVAFVKEPSAR